MARLFVSYTAAAGPKTRQGGERRSRGSSTCGRPYVFRCGGHRNCRWAKGEPRPARQQLVASDRGEPTSVTEDIQPEISRPKGNTTRIRNRRCGTVGRARKQSKVVRQNPTRWENA